MRSFLFSGRNQDTARRVALQGRKERKVFMKKTLLIVAMLLLVATPVMATTTVKVLVNPAEQFTAPDGNKVQPVSIAYDSDADVRAFALDINIDSTGGAPNFQGIRDFKTGESTAASPGYGIFPSRFRDFIVVTSPVWSDPNYNPTVAWNEPESTDTGMGFPKMIVEMGTLFADEVNKPALSGTLFKFDVNAWGATGTFHITVAANTLRGGVVGNDGNGITGADLVLEGNDVSFACTLPDVVSQPEADATANITAAGFALGNRTETCCDVAGVDVGDIVSTNPAAGVQTCGISVDYVVSTGPCCVVVPNIVGGLCSAAEGAITGVGLTVGTVTTAYSDTVAAGLVISQNPTNPDCVALGSAVDYVCSLGPCVVPNVVNNMLEAPIMNPTTNARSTLTNAGFTIGARTTATHATIIAGRLISTTPAAGATPGCGTAVAYTVSTGKGVCATCPGDIVSDSIKQATDLSLLKARMITAFGRTGFYKATKGNIDTGDLWNICGDIVADSSLQATDLSLLKSQLIAGFNAGGFYKAPFVPINVPTKTLAQMQTAITTAKLVVGTITYANDPVVPNGSVISTTPAYPTYRNCNTTVNILVSLGP